MRLPTIEREQVRSELIEIADRLVKRYDITIPEARQTIHEILTVSV